MIIFLAENGMWTFIDSDKAGALTFGHKTETQTHLGTKSDTMCPSTIVQIKTKLNGRS